MILAVGNVKGGVGKTTLAFNLAIALSLKGRDVLLVDGDPQAAAISYTNLRTERQGAPGYTAVALHGIAIRTQVRQLADKYSDIIIDAGAGDTGSLRAAMTVADVILIPVQPRSVDLWATEQTVDLVRQAREVNERLRAVAVLNVADPAGNDNNDALAALAKMDGLEIADYRIVRRKAFPNAASVGLSVLEHSDPKATRELTRLAETLFTIEKNAKRYRREVNGYHSEFKA